MSSAGYQYLRRRSRFALAANDGIVRRPRHRLSSQVDVCKLRNGIARFAVQVFADLVDIAMSVALVRKPAVKYRWRNRQSPWQFDMAHTARELDARCRRFDRRRIDIGRDRARIDFRFGIAPCRNEL